MWTPSAMAGSFFLFPCPESSDLTFIKSKLILIGMKIRFLKNIVVDVETRHGEFFDKAYSHWQEIRIEGVYPYGSFATIKLDNGDILHGVPGDSFEKVVEVKREVVL